MTGGSVTGQFAGSAIAAHGLIPIAAVINPHARRNRSVIVESPFCFAR
jgi:hypothetical protein